MDENDLGESNFDAIHEHLVKYLGESEGTFHEIVSSHVHIDIIIIPPNEKSDIYKLVTSGMSDKPMNYPYEDKGGAPIYSELMIYLPGDWKMDFKDNKYYWPFKLLKTLARFPHELNTFIGHWHTLANENNTPYDQSTKLCGSFLFDPIMEEEEFKLLKIDDNKTINFLNVIPIYQEEMDYKLEHGFEKMIQKLIDIDISFTLDPNRASGIKP